MTAGRLRAAARWEFWREQTPGAASFGEYQGLALDDAVLEQVLGANARAWLRTSCNLGHKENE